MKTPERRFVVSETRPVDPGRRRLLGAVAAASAAAICPPAFAISAPPAERELAFLNLHTGERLTAEYWSGGRYLPDALAEIDRLLRDHRTDEVHPIDPELLDQLYGLRARLGENGEFRVISGYRSPATNAKLRARSGGVARRSLHMQGKAIDIRLAGCETRRLHRAALELATGGVGYYPRSDFVHLDTGRVRSW